MKLPTDNRRSKVVAAITLALMLLPAIGYAQVASSNPLEYVALAEGNELINGQIKSQIEDLKDSVTGLSDNVNGAISSVDSKWSGMSGFLRAMFSGHGGDMFGNFFSNIGKGNVSGLSLVGLVVSALLVFGRFGWLGKIADDAVEMVKIVIELLL
jgi:hypothetical protein